MQAQKIIVIHPGSQNLRIGRSSDLNPLTILHAVGRAKRTKTKAYHDSLLPKSYADDKDILSEFESQRLQVQHIIQAQTPNYHSQQVKRMRVATPVQQIASFNKRSVPDILPHSDEENEIVKTEPGEQLEHAADVKQNTADKIFDQEILCLDKDKSNNYDIHFPMRRGEFNLHKDIGGSIAAVLTDLEDIWLFALKKYFGSENLTNKLSEYAAVLVIPDVYNRSHLRELVTLLLIRFRFRACFLLQENVSSTFGSGLGYACVVDIGDQKCCISCVEDGISQPDTRVRLSMGCGDVTQVFYTLLKKCCFPYKECDPDCDYADAALINQLKERFCHLNFELCGAQERTFEVHKPGKHLRYTIQTGDECIVAPLSLFQTELLNITGRNKRVCIQLSSSQQTDAEDCFDGEYIKETGRRRDQMLEGTMPITGEAADLDDVVDAEEIVAADRENGVNNIKSNEKIEMLYSSNGQILPIHQAIIRSIERCPTEEMKRKMYGCILLVGGGSKIPGFSSWLEKQIVNYRSHNRVSDITNVDVNVFVKDMEQCCWKGAAIMSCLESASELWITKAEWAKHGIRILREKSPFIW